MKNNKFDSFSALLSSVVIKILMIIDAILIVFVSIGQSKVTVAALIGFVASLIIHIIMMSWEYKWVFLESQNVNSNEKEKDFVKSKVQIMILLETLLLFVTLVLSLLRI